MPTLAKSLTLAFTLPRLPRLSLKLDWTARRRRRATIDLIHASPHLLRDIGAVENHVTFRGP